MIDIVAFDADDTLWHNETLYIQSKGKFARLLADYHGSEWVEHKLDETEARNVPIYGYGIKSFTLSMIETAVELTDGQVAGREILEILGLARQMLTADVQLFEHAEETLARLSPIHKLMLITKGELCVQERKVALSGLAEYFRFVEILSEKKTENYRKIFKKYDINPKHFLMVGNSLKSDILPVVSLGGQAVYIPFANTWVHETVVDPVVSEHRYFELEHLGQLPGLIDKLSVQEAL